MATHSSVLAWRILGTGEPGGLLSGVAQSRTRLKRLSGSSSFQLRAFSSVRERKKSHLSAPCLEKENTWRVATIVWKRLIKM